MSAALDETLGLYLAGLEGAGGAGVAVTEAAFDVPLEMRLVVRAGTPVLEASPPRTIWRSGFEPALHRVRFTAVARATPPPGGAEDGDGRGQ